MRGLVAQRRRIGAELPGTLQIYGLVVEHAHARHRSYIFTTSSRSSAEARQPRHDVAVWIEDLPVVYFEFGDDRHGGELCHEQHVGEGPAACPGTVFACEVSMRLHFDEAGSRRARNSKCSRSPR